MRVSDADRESIVTLLREHCVDGRLTLEEFSARLDEAYSARTKGELELATNNLPAAQPSKKRKRRAFMLTLIGSEQRQGRWFVPERIFAFSLLGSPDLDLRQAVIASEEVRTLSIAVIGSLTAIVPAGIDVELRGLSLIGGNDHSTRARPTCRVGRCSRSAASRSSAAPSDASGRFGRSSRPKRARATGARRRIAAR